ncbi:hypothetical protein ABFS83_05G105600 [Erythranthe nasuta]
MSLFRFDHSTFCDREILLKITGENGAMEEFKMDVNSILFSQHSHFFRSLFNNGTSETRCREVAIHIDAADEVAVKSMLQFMMYRQLPEDSASSLLPLLIQADKYAVLLCIKYCIGRLTELMKSDPYTAVICIEVLEQVAVSDRALHDAASRCLRTLNLNELEEKILEFPLVGIQYMLSSNTLVVDSEDSVYDFLLKWLDVSSGGRERELVMSSVRYPFMSIKRLECILTNDRFNVFNLVVDAFVYKVESLHLKRSRLLKSMQFQPRAYTLKPLVVLEFDRPRVETTAYLVLTQEELRHLTPSSAIVSENFYLGGESFYMVLKNVVKENLESTCGVFLKKRGLKTKEVRFELSCATSETNNPIHGGHYVFGRGRKPLRLRDFFHRPWENFVEDNVFFDENVLKIRAELRFTI